MLKFAPKARKNFGGGGDGRGVGGDGRFGILAAAMVCDGDGALRSECNPGLETLGVALVRL